MLDIEGEFRSLRYVGKRLGCGSLVEPAMASMQEFCRLHGEDPAEVGWVEYRPGSPGDIAFGIYLVNEEGRRYVGEDDKAAMVEHVHPYSRANWPSWWIPVDTGEWLFDWYVPAPEGVTV